MFELNCSEGVTKVENPSAGVPVHRMGNSICLGGSAEVGVLR